MAAESVSILIERTKSGHLSSCSISVTFNHVPVPQLQRCRAGKRDGGGSLEPRTWLLCKPPSSHGLWRLGLVSSHIRFMNDVKLSQIREEGCRKKEPPPHVVQLQPEGFLMAVPY